MQCFICAPTPNISVAVCLLITLSLTPALSFANQAPLIKDVAKTLQEDKTAVIVLKGKDPERKKLSFSISQQPQHGTYTTKGLNVIYTPTANYNGSDSFKYTASDGVLTSEATVNLTIQPVNDAPVAVSKDKTVATGIATPIELRGNDIDGDLLSYSISTKPKHGSIAISGNIVTYTSNANYIGVDSFAFKANDKKASSKTAIVNVSVGAVQTSCTLPQVLLSSICTTPQVELTVSKTGTGQGSVSSTPVGLDCGAICNGSFAVGSSITLTATPDANFTFGGWAGACTGTVRTCTVTLSAAASVVANFNIKSEEGTGKLNDTGITGCYPQQALKDSSGNYVQDSNGHFVYGYPCPNTEYPGQDAEFGRDKTDNDDSDGHAGFSFTKVGANGKSLVVQNAPWVDSSGSEAAGTQWSCVQDNVTGLMWEVKTDDNGLHDMDWTYSWYQPDKNKAPFVGNSNKGVCNGTSPCDTDGYVKKVNAAGWCGHKDWRMPSIDELRSIVSFDHKGPAIDTAYFPNTPSGIGQGYFWSSSLGVYVSGSDFLYSVWHADFYYGADYQEAAKYSFSDKHIRLVRAVSE